MSAPKPVPPASTVPRVRNENTLRAVRPNWKNNAFDRQTDDEESEDGHPGEVQHETRRRREEEREEEAEPKRVGKYEGGGRLRNIGDARSPSKKEVEDHNLTHVPYRNQRLHCARGRGQQDRRIREFSFDCCFPGRYAKELLA